MLTNEEYVRRCGIECPFCESSDIRGGSAEFDGKHCSMDVTCEACGKEW